MKIGFALTACLLSFLLHSQDIKIFSESKNPGYILYASNNELCPVSLSLELDLTNLNFSEATQKIFVIPAKAEKFKLGELSVLNPRERLRYSFRYNANYGDINLKRYDTAYAYDLPFMKGKAFKVFQGYNGSFSHQNENALDFTMPEGTEITAAREGIVIKVVQNNTESCPREECKKFNNSVIIYHPDGSFAVYAHIRFNGSKVKVGDAVKKGDIIAYSGNTGWTSGPHLHFACFLPGISKWQTVITKFKIDAVNADYLKEGQVYMKDY